ncbi:hypothetical protein SAMN02746065_104150 [Desulfocicer vacuolatum DSM 3385]|uniref:Uncharacterized protein n=1 Tax=Desulfocicer vacuolatum DSM 3385 TaxID=1121400 RepID=A0A1W2A5V3_9BACT|nr:hypothetical protein SAMN02746065_104150 [Desulfocicer vacuolatum DSM 3385]
MILHSKVWFRADPVFLHGFAPDIRSCRDFAFLNPISKKTLLKRWEQCIFKYDVSLFSVALLHKNIYLNLNAHVVSGFGCHGCLSAYWISSHDYQGEMH